MNCLVTWKSGKQESQSCEDVKIFCNNKNTMCLTKNPEFHARTKHIEIRHHFI
jgi:hypothetical protein